MGYVDNMKSTADITLDVTVGTTAWTTRVWKIKVSQIGCDCPTKPPMSCHQYYLESTGTIASGKIKECVVPRTQQQRQRYQLMIPSKSTTKRVLRVLLRHYTERHARL